MFCLVNAIVGTWILMMFLLQFILEGLVIITYCDLNVMYDWGLGIIFLFTVLS